MPHHKPTKLSAGHYIYRNHYIDREDGWEGPSYWSVSGEIGVMDEDFAHPNFDIQPKTLKEAMKWLDAQLA